MMQALRNLNVILIVLHFLVILVKSDHDGSSDPLDWLRESVPGEPGVDYPVFAEISETSFSCANRIFGGYYADPEMQCQGYHVCLTPPDAATDRKTSFLCPNGTIFSQALLTCDWWFNVDCSATESFYSINEKIGSEEPLADEGSLANSQRGQNQLQRGQGQPQRPQTAQSQPQRGQAQPQRTQSRPQGGQSQPQRGQNQPKRGQSQPQRGQNQPQRGQSQPQRGQNRPNGNGRRKQGSRRKRPQNGGQRKASNQRGVGSAAVQSRGQPQSPQDIEIVQYDATIPGPDDDDVPILLADPFRDIEEPLALYGTPKRG